MNRKSEEQAVVYIIIEEMMHNYMLCMFLVLFALIKRENRKRKYSGSRQEYSLIERIPQQVKYLNRLVSISDVQCLDNLRMDRNTFGKLCMLLKQLGGLEDSRYVSIEEQVAMFLVVLSHHKKIRVAGFDFTRSGETVSQFIHKVLRSLLKIHGIFLAKPTPVDNSCEDPRWNCFKGCIGALDGTHFLLTVPKRDQPRFRNRKGHISTNTLATCDKNLRFTYIQPGWEGSAADGRVLRDAVNRPHGLRVPRGMYYLCDNGYANSEGFVTPYKGARYHLKEWGPDSVKPTSPIELFNMRHTKARNVIERAFGVLKMRWAILRSPSFYPLKIQLRLIMACFLLHNYIRSEMQYDPIESIIDGLEEELAQELGGESEDFVEYIDGTLEWAQFRDNLAQSMWADFQ